MQDRWAIDEPELPLNFLGRRLARARRESTALWLWRIRHRRKPRCEKFQTTWTGRSVDRMEYSGLPHPCRVLCDRVGISTRPKALRADSQGAERCTISRIL